MDMNGLSYAEMTAVWRTPTHTWCAPRFFVYLIKTFYIISLYHVFVCVCFLCPINVRGQTYDKHAPKQTLAILLCIFWIYTNRISVWYGRFVSNFFPMSRVFRVKLFGIEAKWLFVRVIVRCGHFNQLCVWLDSISKGNRLYGAGGGRGGRMYRAIRSNDCGHMMDIMQGEVEQKRRGKEWARISITARTHSWMESSEQYDYSGQEFIRTNFNRKRSATGSRSNKIHKNWQACDSHATFPKHNTLSHVNVVVCVCARACVGLSVSVNVWIAYDLRIEQTTETSRMRTTRRNDHK